MPVSARAAVCRGKDQPFVIEPVTLDALRPDELLIRIVACGICHTHLAVRDGQLPVPLPVVMGHEGSGTEARRPASPAAATEARTDFMGISRQGYAGYAHQPDGL